MHGGSVARRPKCWMDRLHRARSYGGSAAQGPLMRRISCAKPLCPTARLHRATDARGPRRGGAERRKGIRGGEIVSVSRPGSQRPIGATSSPATWTGAALGDGSARCACTRRRQVTMREHRCSLVVTGRRAVYASPVSPAQRTTTAGVRAAPRHRSGPQSPRRPRRLTSGRRHSPEARRNLAVRHGTASRLRSPRHNKPSPFVPTRQAFAVRRGKPSPFAAARQAVAVRPGTSGGRGPNLARQNVAALPIHVRLSPHALRQRRPFRRTHRHPHTVGAIPPAGAGCASPAPSSPSTRSAPSVPR